MRLLFFTLMILAAAAVLDRASAKNIVLPLDPRIVGDTNPTATLLKPRGKGPFPAVVLLHGCSGPTGGFLWVANKVAGWGYVVLFVDSYTTRGVSKGVCTLPWDKWVSAERRSQDAYAGLRYLRSLDFVAKDRIGLLGYSNGGVAALEVSEKLATNSKKNVAYAGGPFTAVFAIYPECGQPYGGWYVTREDATRGPVLSYQGEFKPLQPLLIVTGALDEWTPAEHCVQMVRRSKSPNLDIIVYPGAHHAFDTMDKVHYFAKARNINAMTGYGTHVGGNAKARKQLYIDMRSFLDKHLKNAKVQ